MARGEGGARTGVGGASEKLVVADGSSLSSDGSSLSSFSSVRSLALLFLVLRLELHQIRRGSRKAASEHLVGAGARVAPAELHTGVGEPE